MPRNLLPFETNAADDRNCGDPDGALDPAELAAAEWLVRQDRGLTPAQERGWQRWLQADARHARLHAKLRETWGMLEAVPASRFSPRRRHQRATWLAIYLAAAAVVAISFVARFDSGEPVAEPLAHIAVTGAGGFKTMDLPDGSVVALNADSAIEFDFTPSERRVHLVRGEANFAVTKNAARPFIVRAGEVDIRAVGTAFNVRLGQAAVEVLVTEGKVRVDNSASGLSLIANSPSRTDSADPKKDDPPTESLLLAGQRVVIPFLADAIPSAPASAAVVEPDEMERELAWQSRTLEFSDETLANVVGEFNRYNRNKLVIADAQLAQQRFGGKFPAHDYESFVSFLEANFGVVVRRQGNETILRSAK